MLRNRILAEIQCTLGCLGFVFVLLIGCQKNPTDDPAFCVIAQADKSKVETSSAKIDVDSTDFRQESIRGRVVFLNPVLKERLGISTVSEAAESSLAILTDAGKILPIIEDSRGRAFRVDERLRAMNLELLVRRYDMHPMIQILRVYEIVDGERYQVDYWCDVCAISMIEKGSCSCCQDENRIRKELVP